MAPEPPELVSRDESIPDSFRTPNVGFCLVLQAFFLNISI